MSELYAFMDGADATLARKVLGEAAKEGADGEAGEAAPEAGEGRGWGEPQAWQYRVPSWKLRPARADWATLLLRRAVTWELAHPTPAFAGDDASEDRRDRDAATYRRALYDIMACTSDVRKRAEATDAMFEPLRDTVASLQGAGVALPDGVLRQVGGGRLGREGWRKRVAHKHARTQASSLCVSCGPVPSLPSPSCPHSWRRPTYVGRA